MGSFLNLISIISSFMVTFGVLFFLQKYTLGYLLKLNNRTLFGKYITSDIIFSVTSFLIILNFIDFYKPH